MKQCACCSEQKPLEDFAYRNKSRGTRQPYCNTCRREKARRSYNKHKQTNVARSIKNRLKRIERFNDYKEQFSCCVCGEEETVCLDFHHIDPTTKKFSIGEYRGNVGWTTLLEEIEKCVCVCSNCHRKIHAGIIVV